MLPFGESEVGSIFTKNEMTGREQNKKNTEEKGKEEITITK